MNRSKSASRFFVAAALSLMLTLTISSCGSKEGCPNKITEVAGVSLDTNT